MPVSNNAFQNNNVHTNLNHTGNNRRCIFDNWKRTIANWCPCAKRRYERTHGNYFIIRPDEALDPEKVSEKTSLKSNHYRDSGASHDEEKEPFLRSHTGRNQQTYNENTLADPPFTSNAMEGDTEKQAAYFLQKGLEAFDNSQFKKAESFYNDSASLGNIIAVHNLGTMYLYGQGIQKNAEKAHECFLLCSRHEVAASMGQLGYMYMYGKGVDQSYDTAKEWFLRANKVGKDAYSQFQLGCMYLEGIGTPVNSKKGFYWLCKSVKSNYLPAIYNLGVLFMTGMPEFPQDLLAAAVLFEHAANFGDDPYSQNNLGVLYATGEGNLRQDYKKAFKYFKSASEKELTEAQFNLGECYNNGYGIDKDLTSAAEYYYLATKNSDNSLAEFRLAQLFLYSEATFKQDLSMALYWFGRSAQHRNEMALTNYTALKTLLEANKDTSPEFQKSRI
ncbi:hypothetical protein DASB73_009100 [Starmerella bacillaris]|uniref:Uncharacterized protein n=1 Tax=Starmerella bacillaris TaxID=1247836 RepID=A0AAV5RFE1_STABA|nr:hypothetical protein DASB73_009100 [Starmerella bacillaris]